MSGSPALVLQTGATGFIGNHLLRHLLDAGHAVRALVRQESVARAVLDPRGEVQVGALTDAGALSRALEGVTRVVYGAGAVRGREPKDFRSANVDGVTLLVEELRQRQASDVHVVLISSLAAHRPELSAYASSKRCGEEVLRRAEDISWTILRPPAVYGPGDTEMQRLFAMARRGLALRPGPVGQRVALLHVHDLVRAVSACLANPSACRHQCYAIDDGTPGGYDFQHLGAAVAGRPVREVGVPGWLLAAAARLNEAAAAALRYQPMLTRGKVRELQQASWLCDNSAFTRATGWQPAVDLERGAAALFQ